MALAANVPPAGEHGVQERWWPKPPVCETVTTKVIVTYTTVCPITETFTKPGHTYTKTYTTTSTVVTAVPTTIVITKTSPPVTETTGEGWCCTLTLTKRTPDLLAYRWTRSRLHDPH